MGAPAKDPYADSSDEEVGKTHLEQEEELAAAKKRQVPAADNPHGRFFFKRHDLSVIEEIQNETEL